LYLFGVFFLAANGFHLFFKVNPKFFVYAFPYLAGQVQDISCAGVAVVDNEIGVQIRYHGPVAPGFFHSGLLNEKAC
jgi:hypothetical protein